MKILLLSHRFYPDIGGIETISEILSERFCMSGHEVRVITWSLDATQKKFSFKVIRKPSIKRLFSEHSWADVVFENNPCIRLGWPSLFFRRPCIIGLQTWLTAGDNHSGIYKHFKTLWIKRASKVIACSKAVQKEVWPKAVVIGNPYDENIFKKYPNIDRVKDFVFLGRLVSDKGADLAIKAFNFLITRLMTDANIKPSLTIIGDGPEKENLQELMVTFQLQQSVSFTGSLRGQEIAKKLNEHRVLLVPSLWKEPFGIVALEGLACGCIPIVANRGGLPDAVGSGGLIFESGNLESLATVMNESLQKPEIHQNLQNAAAAHLHFHTTGEVSRHYLSIIESVFTDHSQALVE
ncbi:MAG: glycosyltransferase family 4 protein [Bacteroidota bacterium]|nr:glycosyltransferase family 4 protein [Bacteroidota bacterium]